MKQIQVLILLVSCSAAVAQSTGGYGGGASRTQYTFVLKDETGTYKGGNGGGTSRTSYIFVLKDETGVYMGGNGGGGNSKIFQATLEDLAMYTGGDGRGDTSITFEFGLGGNNQRRIVDEIFTSKNFEVKVQPNPTTNHFTMIVTTSNAEKIQLRVTDILGRIREERIIESGRVQLGDGWNVGVYFLEIIQGEVRTVVRLVKQ